MDNISMEALDFRYLLIEHYKKIGLDENELSVILVIDDDFIAGKGDG